MTTTEDQPTVLLEEIVRDAEDDFADAHNDAIDLEEQPPERDEFDVTVSLAFLQALSAALRAQAPEIDRLTQALEVAKAGPSTETIERAARAHNDILNVAGEEFGWLVMSASARSVRIRAMKATATALAAANAALGGTK